MYQTLIVGTSILIPSWNNLPYLKKCVESIREHSEFKHEIVVHVNEGTDGTLEWCKEQGLIHTHSTENVGVCVAMNRAFEASTKDGIFYFNDDMVALPGWDSELAAFALKNNLDTRVWLSSTMMEPRGDNICCLAPFNYGESVSEFREADLIRDLPQLKKIKGNVKGSTWPPNVIHRDLWKEVGGYSEEFSPGFGSDPDLAHKLYNVGVREFIGVGSSLVYHFICKTTGVKKFVHNNSEAQFRNKYGYSINDFVYHLLQRGNVWTPHTSSNR